MARLVLIRYWRQPATARRLISFDAGYRARQQSAGAGTTLALESPPDGAGDGGLRSGGGWHCTSLRATPSTISPVSVVIDGPAYNGRNSEDTLIGALKGTDPLASQPVDGTHPYLLFGADVDASGDADATLKNYTTTLWETMGEEIRDIFQHCVGFDTVRDAAAFHQYIQRCQLETTMPFNDYWLDGFPVGAGEASQLPRYVKLAAYVFLGCGIALVCIVALHFAFVALGIQNTSSESLPPGWPHGAASAWRQLSALPVWHYASPTAGWLIGAPSRSPRRPAAICPRC